MRAAWPVAPRTGLREFPPCFVCGERVRDVPVEERARARRSMNVPVVVAEPGHEKHPDGLVRHSYCEPGTRRWAQAQGTQKKAREWCRLFGFVRKGGNWIKPEDEEVARESA